MTDISKSNILNSSTWSQFNSQNFNTQDKEVAGDGIALAASTVDVEAFANIAAVIDNCEEIIKQDVDPFDEIIAKVKEGENFGDELEANGVVCFLEID